MIIKFNDIKFGREPNIRPAIFSSGEDTYRANEAYTGQNIVIQCPEMMDGDDFYSLLQIVDCIRKFANPYVFMPYFKGSRQHRDNQSAYATMDAVLNQRLLFAAGAQGVYTIDLHSPVTTPHVTNLLPYTDLARYLSRYGARIDVVIAPDLGAASRAKALAKSLGSQVGQYLKERNGKDVRITYDSSSPDLKDKNCVIIDDIIASGKTMLQVIDDVQKRGGQVMAVFATHCFVQNFTPFVDKSVKIIGVTGIPDINLPGEHLTSLVDEFVQRIDKELNQ